MSVQEKIEAVNKNVYGGGRVEFAPKAKLNLKKIKRLGQAQKKEVKQIEAQIEKYESEIADLETQLADPALYKSPDQYEKINTEYSKKKQELEELMEKWEQIA